MDDVRIVRANGNNVMVIKQDRSAWSFGTNANGTQGIGVSPSGSMDPIYPHQIADQVKEVFPMGYTCFFFLKKTERFGHPEPTIMGKWVWHLQPVA